MSAVASPPTFHPLKPNMGPPDLSNCYIGPPAVPGSVPPELFQNFPPNAPAAFSTNFHNRRVRFIPKPAPQYAVRTHCPIDIFEKANYFREKYPEFVYSIQQVPVAWEDLYMYFDPLDIWEEGAGFCFHVIHRLAVVNIEKRRQIELFVADWAENNFAKLARVPPHAPVTSVFGPEDYRYFDFENLAHFEINTVCASLNQQCLALQPRLHFYKVEQARLAEVDRQKAIPPTPILYRPHVQSQVSWQGSPRVISKEGLISTIVPESNPREEFYGRYQGRRQDISYEGNQAKSRCTSGSFTFPQACEPIYTYTPHQRPQIGSRRPSGQGPVVQTPTRSFTRRGSFVESNQNRNFTAASTGDNRPRASSNGNSSIRVQTTYPASRYDAAAEIGKKTATVHSRQRQNTGGYFSRPAVEAGIAEGRSIYIRGYTPEEFCSDLVPNMMGSCGEIEVYYRHFSNTFAFITFKSRENALEAIERFNGKVLDNGEILTVAPQHPRKHWDNSSSSGPYPYHRGNLFTNYQRFPDDSSRGRFDNADRSRFNGPSLRTNGNTEDVRNASQKPREKHLLPMKPVDTPPKLSLTSKKHKQHQSEDSDSTLKGKKGSQHHYTSSEQSSKTVKANGKSWSSNTPVVTPPKKGSFSASEDLSVPDEGEYGTSFSSTASLFEDRKASIFDNMPANGVLEDKVNAKPNIISQESSVNGCAISTSPEPQDSRAFPPIQPKKSSSFGKKKKKTKSKDITATASESTNDSASQIDVVGNASIAPNVSKTTDKEVDSIKSSKSSVSVSAQGSPSKASNKHKQSSSNIPFTKNQQSVDESLTSTSTKNHARSTQSSPRRMVTETGSPRLLRSKHSKSNSDVSWLGGDPRKTSGYGLEKSNNNGMDKVGENAQSDEKNQTESKLYKRTKSNAELKRENHINHVTPAAEINILADPTQWPTLGGKSQDPNGASWNGQAAAAPLAMTQNRRFDTRRDSMAAVISQKIKVVPVVPLRRPSPAKFIDARSVSSESTRSDDTIIPVVNTTGTRLWPVVVNWAGKPLNAEAVGTGAPPHGLGAGQTEATAATSAKKTES